MGNQDKKFFLGKKGKVHGPFSRAELEQFQLSGQIENYTYLWHPEAREWRNIDPLPPAPGPLPTSPGAKDNRIRFPSGSLEAVCHNSESIVAGRLENITDAGCDLVTHDPSEAPRLGVNASLLLNVMAPSKDKSTNIRASLGEISRQAGHWVYHLRWAHRPTF